MSKDNQLLINKNHSTRSWIQVIVVALLLAFIITKFIFNTTVVQGISMEPTLHERDRMICLVYPLYYSDPERGALIIFASPYEKKNYVKRVIGIPGDEVEILNGKVYVNGDLLEENYIHKGLDTLVTMENKWTLGKDEYFVLGDNRHEGASVDSRSIGPVSKESIRSIAKIRYFPFTKMGTL
ncbi:MAG: signal peptidase I [Tissierellia bacterium]|nr:signal peptidase I [Tissierellia bacterium]